MEERRKGTRLSLEARLVIKRIDQQEGEEVKIDIVDMSKSGIGFTCKERLAMGAVYEAHLRIWTQEVIHAILEITRMEEKEGQYDYGAFFLGMPEADSVRIEVYDMVEREKEKQDRKNCEK